MQWDFVDKWCFGTMFCVDSDENLRKFNGVLFWILFYLWPLSLKWNIFFFFSISIAAIFVQICRKAARNFYFTFNIGNLNDTRLSVYTISKDNIGHLVVAMQINANDFILFSIQTVCCFFLSDFYQIKVCNFPILSIVKKRENHFTSNPFTKRRKNFFFFDFRWKTVCALVHEKTQTSTNILTLTFHIVHIRGTRSLTLTSSLSLLSLSPYFCCPSLMVCLYFDVLVYVSASLYDGK